MREPIPSTRQIELQAVRETSAVARDVRRPRSTSLLLDGAGGFSESWRRGPLLALEPRVELELGSGSLGGAEDFLAGLDRLVAARRAGGGASETGVAALLAYEFFDAVPRWDRAASGAPRAVVLSVDRSLRWTGGNQALLTVRHAAEAGAAEREREWERALRVALHPAEDGSPRVAARRRGSPRSSLPRERYLRALEALGRHISRGDIYQANLCQQFRVGYRGDELELYLDLASQSPAPHSAFVQTPGFALASISPETFLRADGSGTIETWPIKGTRPRGVNAENDRAAARELLASPKDRAELLMIVDLERNDLSRVCRPGTVSVDPLAELRSYAAVHHMVARVQGVLREGVDVPELIRATFPGGSISGAPKIRAMEILRRLETVPRGFFSGSLFWFGDDGSLDSSILIRTVVFDGERAFLGAGGGIVADSEPEQEWRESNHKARALASALGFEPEEAS